MTENGKLKKNYTESYFFSVIILPYAGLPVSVGIYTWKVRYPSSYSAANS